MAKKAKLKAPRTADDLQGKTIQEAQWTGHTPEDGYGDLRLLFTDGTWISVCYSCMGGVYLEANK